MKTSTSMLLTALLFLTGIHCTKDPESDHVSLSQQDGQFLVKASYGNWNEVGAGALAAQQGMNAGVRTFGQKMVIDHGSAENELVIIANRLGLNLPYGPDSTHIAIIAALGNMSGTAFDSAYIASQIFDHQTAVALFQSEISGGLDSSLVKYAQRYLPAIQMHLTMADSLMAVLHH